MIDTATIFHNGIEVEQFSFLKTKNGMFWGGTYTNGEIFLDGTWDEFVIALEANFSAWLTERDKYMRSEKNDYAGLCIVIMTGYENAVQSQHQNIVFGAIGKQWSLFKRYRTSKDETERIFLASEFCSTITDVNDCLQIR